MTSKKQLLKAFAGIAVIGGLLIAWYLPAYFSIPWRILVSASVVVSLIYLAFDALYVPWPEPEPWRYDVPDEAQPYDFAPFPDAPPPVPAPENTTRDDDDWQPVRVPRGAVAFVRELRVPE